MLDKNCWMCDTRYDSTKQLKNHLAGSTHNHQMEVICPWCPDSPVRYRRVTELKEHAGRAHKEIIKELPPDVLSEGNGYYVCLHPEVYRRVVKPSSFYSRPAREIKAAMRNYISHTKNNVRTMQEWEAGWRQGTRYDGPSGEEDFTPIYSGDEGAAVKNTDISDVNAWRVTYIALIPQDLAVQAEYSGTTYNFTLEDSILSEPRAVASLSRKMLTLPRGGSAAVGQRLPLTGRAFADRVALAVKLLGIQDKYFKCVHRIDSSFGLMPTKTTKPSVQPVHSSPVKTQPPPFSATPVTTSNLQYSPVSNATYSPIRDVTPPPPPPPAKKPRLEYVPTPKALLETIQPKPTNTRTTPTSSISTNVNSASSRARKLLAFGCMPLFPPARRDWTGENTITLPGEVSSKTWPPMNWRKLTADQRKLQWEFIAFQYEQSLGSAWELDRAGLLDKYNMFALPGTAPHPKAKKDGKTAIKSRYYMYESVRLLALEEKKPDRNTFRMLDMLEKASAGRDRTTDRVCEVMEVAGVPLRLDA